jgi:transcription elongation factor GreA
MSNDLDEKKKTIKDELERLKYEFKIELPKKIAEARTYGDLKENAEYHAARERQSFVKARISQLAEQLGQLNNLNFANILKDKISFGSKVSVTDTDTGEQSEFTLVSANEVNPADGKISMSSPIGIALQNKIVGDEVAINIPAGKRRLLIRKFTTIHGEEFK